MFAVRFLVVLLAGITQKTDGSLTFTNNPPSPFFVKEGSDAVLKWEYYVDQKPAELDFITWTVNVKALGSNKKMIQENAAGLVINHAELPATYVGRVGKKDQATLIIKNVTFEDSTEFTCTLTAKSGAETPNIVQLIVTGPAVCKPNIQLVELGDSATITCNATGVPSENRTCTGPGVLEKNCSQFTIPDKPVSKAAYYSCNATLDINEPNVDKCFVQVIFPPQQDKTTCTQSLFSATMNESLSICCPVNGYPPPTVTWKKNGIQHHQGQSTVWTIPSVKDEHLGNYTCTATRGETMPGETPIGPFIITVVKTVAIDIVDDLFVSVISGTSEKPAKLEVQPHAHAENYVVKIEGEGIMTDFLTGTQPSLEVHYHTLVMEETGKKPPEINICVDVSAMNDERVLAKTPTCQKLTIKKPSDTEI